MNTATKLHKNGQQHIVHLAHALHQLWVKMCEHDGIDPTAKFVDLDCFDKFNPYCRFYNEAQRQYWQAISDYQAGGYVGITIHSRKGG